MNPPPPPPPPAPPGRAPPLISKVTDRLAVVANVELAHPNPGFPQAMLGTMFRAPAIANGAAQARAAAAVATMTNQTANTVEQIGTLLKQRGASDLSNMQEELAKSDRKSAHKRKTFARTPRLGEVNLTACTTVRARWGCWCSFLCVCCVLPHVRCALVCVF